LLKKGTKADPGILVVDYGTSVIVAKEGESMKQGDGTDVMGKESLRVIIQQDLAKDIKVGMRMSRFKVLNQACPPAAFPGAAQEQGLLAAGDICGQH
jgi:phenol 2-monooxygenase (NADPH)